MKRFYLLIFLLLAVVLVLGGAAGAQDNDDEAPLDEDRDVYFVPVEEISISLTEMTLVLDGQPGILTVDVKPLNATNPNIIWSSSDEDVATVEARSDAVITPVGPGRAIITAISEDGGFTASTEVTVLAEKPVPTPPTGDNNLLLLIIGGGALILAGALLSLKPLIYRHNLKLCCRQG